MRRDRWRSREGYGPQLEKTVQARTYEVFDQIPGLKYYNLSQARASKQTPGILDCYVRHVRWGIAGWIEFKRPGDPRSKPTQEQQEFIDGERALGRFVAVVTSPAEAMEALRRAGAPIRL